VVQTNFFECCQVEILVQDQLHGVTKFVFDLSENLGVFFKILEPILIKGHKIPFYLIIKSQLIDQIVHLINVPW